MGFVGLIFAPFLIAGIFAVIGSVIADIHSDITRSNTYGLILHKKHRTASKVLFILAVICICFLITVIFIMLIAVMLLFSHSLTHAGLMLCTTPIGQLPPAAYL